MNISVAVLNHKEVEGKKVSDFLLHTLELCNNDVDDTLSFLTSVYVSCVLCCFSGDLNYLLDYEDKVRESVKQIYRDHLTLAQQVRKNGQSTTSGNTQ